MLALLLVVLAGWPSFHVSPSNRTELPRKFRCRNSEMASSSRIALLQVCWKTPTMPVIPKSFRALVRAAGASLFILQIHLLLLLLLVCFNNSSHHLSPPTIYHELLIILYMRLYHLALNLAICPGCEFSRGPTKLCSSKCKFLCFPHLIVS